MGVFQKIDPSERLTGPDLRKLPTLVEYLARLDAALGDAETYAEEWLAVSAEMSGASGGFLMWDPNAADDDEPHLYRGGIACDYLEAERVRRSDAIYDHMPKTDEVRAAIVGHLLRHGAYSDNRPAPGREVIAAIRSFIAHRGRLMLDPKGRLEVGGCWPGQRDDDRTDDQLDDALLSARVLSRLARRWRGRELIKRTIRILGKRAGDWLILEAANG